MNKTFCTIITANYCHYALTLHDSLLEEDTDAHLAIFISNGEISERHKKELHCRNGIALYYFQDLENFGLCRKLKEKYFEDYHDAFRWGMKPVFINYLLQAFEKVVYLDSDLYFYNNFTFIFEELDSSNVLLTPHWRTRHPAEPNNFRLSFQDGIYNAGFIATRKGAEEAMDWWAKMIYFKCTVDRRGGFYVDQKFLDLMPVHFDGVAILRHKGCNVANWNKIECKRNLSNEGEVLINNQFPIIFIHFTNTMLKGIFYENDILLKPYLEKYRDNLLIYSDLDIIEDYFERGRFKKSRSENDFKKEEKSNLKKLHKKTNSFVNRIIRNFR